MRNFLLALSLLAGFAFSADCSGLADLEINYLGIFKSISDFSKSGSIYSINLPREADKIDLRPTGCYEGAAVTGGFENAYLPVGTTSYPVTAGGSSYTVNITRAIGSLPVDTKNTLSGLKVNSGANMFTLNPAFNSGTLAYSVQIPFKAGAVSVDATLDYRYGGLKYENSGGNEVSNVGISLTPGQAWVMKIRVIAEDAAVSNGIYTLTLNKMQGNTNSNLASLQVFLDGDAFENQLPDFDPLVLSYTLNVSSGAQTATVKSSKAEQFFGEFEGQNEWIDKPLACGDNAFSITVVPETGAKKTYTLNIIKACPSSSSVADMPSSSSTTATPSSGSNGSTPARLSQAAIGSIRAYSTGNSIVLENLPSNAKVEIYNLQGKRIYSAYPENPKILRIGVQTKGIYIAKIGGIGVQTKVMVM